MKKVVQTPLSSAAVEMLPHKSCEIDFNIDEEGYSIWILVWVASMTAIEDITELAEGEVDLEISSGELLSLAGRLHRIATTSSINKPLRVQK